MKKALRVSLPILFSVLAFGASASVAFAATPTVQGASVTTNEDTSIRIILNASDADSPALTLATTTSPTNGTLSPFEATTCTVAGAGTDCTTHITYTPNLNFNGSDTFLFVANDGTSTSTPGTVSVTITAVNDAPVATSTATTTTSNTSVSITLSATDVDNPTLSFATTSSPTNGTLGPIASPVCVSVGSGTSCTATTTYTPTLNVSVIDTFTFKANDGTLNSNVATATITVTAVAVTAPSLLTAASFGVLADTFTNTGVTTIIGNVGYTTPPATPAIVNGTVFTPKPVQAGLDQAAALASLNAQSCTFVFATGAINLSTDTTHGLGGVFSPGVYCSTGAMSITGPLTLSGSGTYIFRPVGALDSAASSIVTLTGATAANVFWTPSGATTLGANSTFAGTVIDNAGITVGSTVVWTGRALAFGGTVTTTNDSISVPGVVADIAPVASSTSATTAEDTPVSVTFSATDVDGNMLSFATTTSPLHGTLGAFASSTCTTLATTSTCTSSALYTPALNFNGADLFNVVANDGVLNSAMATATIAITAVNDAPVASPTSTSTPEDTSVSVTLSATDIDSPSLSFHVMISPINGALGPIGPSSCTPVASGTSCTATTTYTPALNFNGTDTFTFMANDGLLDSNAATSTVTVTAVNDAPVATAASATTNENSPVSVTLSATDIDSPALTFLSVSSPTSGILGTVSSSTCVAVASSSSCTAHVTYTPALNFNGTDTFTFKANDGSLNSNVATATVNIAAVLSFVATTNADGSLTATTTNATTATTSASGVLAALTIPTGTVITGPATWDQTLSLPVTTATFTLTPDAGNTAAAVTAVEVGAGDTPLTLDTAAMLSFTGQAGMLVGWSQAGVFHPITSTCDSTTTPTLAVGGDCKVDVGADLVVFTKHLSTFVVYTQTPIPPAPVTPATSSGSGQSFGAISPVFMGNATEGNASGGVTASTVVPGLPQTGIAPQAISSGLSDKQVESLIMVLNSFGVDKVTMNKVLASLHRSALSGQVSFPNTGNATFSRDLKSGETDTDVESLQKFLNGHGFAVSDSGPGSSGQETTSFGPKTRAALIKFQKARGITPAVGFFGPKTRAAVASEQ